MVQDNPTLKDRLNLIHHRIKLAASRSNRSESDVKLVAVTKYISVDVINDVVRLGAMDLGENKVQEAKDKRERLSPPDGQKLIHHLLGYLQTNKARKAVELFDLIQSVDRPKCAVFLDRAASDLGIKQDCLIEVKVSDEENKTGLPQNEAVEFIANFKQYKNLNLKGLMTMAPFDRTDEETRECFRSFAQFFLTQKPHLGDEPILSMGMTDDFEIAIEEGSTMVRIGRALFGERESHSRPL